MATTSANLKLPVTSSRSPAVPPRPQGAPVAAVETDEALLARIAEGDEKAFRRLVERHIDRAYALALRILKRPADAEDVVQDAMLKVWTHRGRWQAGRAQFSTWLYRVVTNRCIDLVRRPVGQDLAVAAEPMDDSVDAMRGLMRREALDALEEALGRLPPQQRAALALSYHEGLGNAEIAEVMGVSVMAVESLLKRAREQMRKTLRRASGDLIAAFTDD